MKISITILLSAFLLCGCASKLTGKRSLLGAKTSEYPNRPSVTNGGWLMLWAESGVTNYNQSWNQHTQQLWKAVLGPTNYGTTTLIGGLSVTNIVLSPLNFTNYTISGTNSVEQEIITANTNVLLTVAADHAYTPVTVWVNALTSTVSAVVIPPATARTNIDFVSTITNGTSRTYRIEFRGGVNATNLHVTSNPSAVR